MAKVEIDVRSTGEGCEGVVKVDGVSIPNVKSTSFSAPAQGSPPTVTIVILADELTARFDGIASIEFAK